MYFCLSLPFLIEETWNWKFRTKRVKWTSTPPFTHTYRLIIKFRAHNMFVGGHFFSHSIFSKQAWPSLSFSINIRYCRIHQIDQKIRRGALGNLDTLRKLLCHRLQRYFKEVWVAQWDELLHIGCKNTICFDKFR